MRRSWQLGEPSPGGGCIIQEVTWRARAWNAAGEQIDPAGNPATGWSERHFWEAWRIHPGDTTPINPYDDFRFTNVYGLVARYEIEITATASFYEGYVLPGTFRPYNRDTFAGSLPATTINPNLPPSGVPPVEITVRLTWP